MARHAYDKEIANTCPHIYSSRSSSQMVPKVEEEPNSHMEISDLDIFRIILLYVGEDPRSTSSSKHGKKTR